MHKSLLVTLLTLLFTLGLHAQVTSDPTPLQEDSKGVVIFFHADEGNKGLAGQPASAQIYAHTGVITSKSNGGSDWKYAPTWGENTPKYKLEYVSENLWRLYIGDIRKYYGVTDPEETIKQLTFVFRNADCSKEGKAEGNKDIFLNVYQSGLQVSLESSLSGKLISPSNTHVTFTMGATEDAELTITVNGEKIASAASAKELKAEYNFTNYGSYTVRAEARNSVGLTASETLELGYLAPSAQGNYPGGSPVMGTKRNADGTVTFCLAAPQKSSVFLVGSWNDYAISSDQVMKYQDVNGFRYFWTTVSGLAADKMYPYYYVVDYDINVGDPYAKLVLDPWNDKYIPASVYPGLPAFPVGKVPEVSLAVYQENINDFDWKYADFKPAANQDLMIYELLFRDFTGTEGKADGNGTVRQACGHLDYLQGLGVNAIELLPINEFNGNISWGYNPNFYFAPDKAYGTPEDYKTFIDACHSRGMAVILDVVFNQTDWQHPWYQMYEVGKNPFYNASAPHAYSVLNDWNQGYPLVQTQFKDMLRYWLEEYKVDGFRFDLVKGLGDNDSYANSGDAATNAYNASRVKRMHELQLAAKEVNPNVIIINENLAGEKEENEMAAYGQLNWSNWNNGGCQYAMGYQSESSLSGMYAPFASRTWGSTVSYLESHDEQRLAYKQSQWGVYAVKNDPAVAMRRLGSAAAQMIMAPGAHMIWQFSELGDGQNAKDDNGGNNTDPKIVVWNYLNDANRMGLRNSYKELLWLRRNNSDLFAESATFSSTCGENDWTNGRSLISRSGDKELFTLINPNLSGDLTFNVNFAKKDNSAYEIFSKSYESQPSFSATAGTVTVPAGGYVVVGSKNIVSVEGISASDASLSVWGEEGVLKFTGAVAPVYVFTTDGRQAAVSAQSDDVLSLAGSIYIVGSGDVVAKKFVR